MTDKKPFTTIDGYISTFPADIQVILEKVRQAIHKAAPEAAEIPAATAVRLARLLRLHRDLEVDLLGAAVIVDLLERMDGMERELARLRGWR